VLPNLNVNGNVEIAQEKLISDVLTEGFVFSYIGGLIVDRLWVGLRGKTGNIRIFYLGELVFLSSSDMDTVNM
jgi:hypothetical protein